MPSFTTIANELAFAKCSMCKGAGGFTEQVGPSDAEQYRCETCIRHPGFMFGNEVRTYCPTQNHWLVSPHGAVVGRKVNPDCSTCCNDKVAQVTLRSLFVAIREQTGARLVVDTSFKRGVLASYSPPTLWNVKKPFDRVWYHEYDEDALVAIVAAVSKHVRACSD